MSEIIKFDILSESFGLVFNDNKETFQKYADLFMEYNSHTNLISKNDEKVLFEKHVFDSLAISLFFKKYKFPQESKILDIGTGGGFPSLPIAICYPESRVCALDSIKKKITFIDEAKSVLDIKNIEPICSRVEDLPQEKKESFDLVVSRAVADLNVIAEYALPFVKIGGYFVVYKSRGVEEEISASKVALHLLGAKLADKIEYKLPLDSNFKRVLVVIKKVERTPKKYPRKNSAPKKNPL